MTTHRRGWLLRAGVIGALALGPIAVFAPPAMAAPNLQVSANSPTLSVGAGAQNLNVTVKNNGDDPSTATNITITVPTSTDLNITVGNVSGCNKTAANILSCAVPVLTKDQTKLFAVPLTPPASSNLQPNAETSGNGEAQLESPDRSANFKVTLKAGSAATVPEVNGSVADIATGKPVAGAAVLIVDSAGKQATVNTGTDGKFRAPGPWTPGTFDFAAGKDGFESGTASKEGRAGAPLAGVQIKLKAMASAAAEPSDTGAATDPANSGEPGAGQPETENASNGTSMLSWVLIGLGGLLVALGIGAIVLLLVRRRDDRDDEGDLDEGLPQRRGPAPAGRPAYRGGADPTMVGRGAPMGGMDDATAIVRTRPPVDEFPDPYAAPRSAYPTSPGPAGYGRTDPGYGRDPGYGPRGGYGQPGYGAGGGPGAPGGPGPGGPGYGEPAGYGSARPVSGDRGYGASEPTSGGVYGADESRPRYGLGGADPAPRRYGADEPTGRFSPPASGPPRAGGYAPDNGPGYGPDNGSGYGAGGNAYGRPGYDPPAGPDTTRGYERPPAPGRGAPDPGYDSGYDRPGYQDPRAGDPRAGDPRAGQPPAGGRGSRRPVEWLDD